MTIAAAEPIAEPKPKLSTVGRFLQYFAPYRQELPVALLMVMIGATPRRSDRC
jgi:ATP-binding cassette subfamily B multidrug efflux pump